MQPVRLELSALPVYSSPASKTGPYTQAATSGKDLSAKSTGFPRAAGQFSSTNPTASRKKQLPLGKQCIPSGSAAALYSFRFR